MRLTLQSLMLTTLGLSSLTSVAATTDGILGVANKMDGTASIINISTGETKTVKVGYLPHEIAIGNGFAYVSNYGGAHIRSSDLRNHPGNTISAIQLTEPYQVSEIDLGPARCAPHGLFISKSGNWLFTTCEGRNEIAVVDLNTRTLSHTIATNQAGSHLIVLSSDDSRAYVSNFWHGTISVLDLKSRKLVAQVFTGRGSEGLAISADDQSVYTTRVEANEVVKVDTKTLKVVARRTFPEGTSPIRVWPAPNDATKIVVNNSGAGSLQILNASDLSPIKEIKVGNQPIGLTVSNTNYAFSANMNDNTISKINLNSGEVESTFKTGNAPDGIAFHP